MELLAPAGSLKKLKFAIEYGADAVYASGKLFGLRANATNFSVSELEEAVEYCHSRNKKIFITINIFAQNHDLGKIPDFLKSLERLKVDGLIISDPAIFSLAQEFAPSIDIHISTQANVTSWKSAEFWGKLGATRIILARELSIAEISEFKQNLPNLEIEMFVHGAMCMAYSGRCLLSAFLNNRNANKGECTQPCRWNYKIVEQKRPNENFEAEEDQYGTYIFNSKDLNLSHRLAEIIDAGVDSIKIEGRMKSVFYVANVTRIYRRLIDLTQNNKTMSEEMLAELNSVSHRLFTEGFFDGKNSYDLQNYESSSYIRDYQFIGEIIESTDSYFVIKNHAKFIIGEEISLIFPDIDSDFVLKVEEILDENNNPIEFTKPNTTVKIPYSHKLPDFGIVRKLN